MKTKYYILFLGLILTAASCEKDNYEAPDATFSGQLTYGGEPIGVAADEVRFQLWQSGFGNEGPLDVHVAQDGSFSALFHSGDYRLDFLDGQGPFKANIVNQQQLDTIYIDLRGDLMMDIEVTPWYMIRNAQFSLSGNTVSASASLEQIITDEDARNIERVTLYVNTTQFVSDNSDENVARTDADLTDLSNLSMSLELPEDYNRDYAFARIGVKIEGVEDMLYSQVEKLEGL